MTLNPTGNTLLEFVSTLVAHEKHNGAEDLADDLEFICDEIRLGKVDSVHSVARMVSEAYQKDVETRVTQQ